MKKILIATNLLWISIILVQACQQKQNNNAGNETTSGNGKMAGVSSSYCADTVCSPVSNGQLTGLIDYKTAKSLSDFYGQDEGKRLIYKNGQLTDEEDSRNIWFDFEKMKMFIRYIERNACLAGCNKTNTRLGIRVYLGKYPDSSMLGNINLPSLMGVKKAYGYHTTVFFAPTYYDPIAKKNIDFDPGTTREGCKFFPITETNGKGMVYLGVDPEGTTTNPDNEQNHGDVAPPPKATGAFPTVPTGI